MVQSNGIGLVNRAPSGSIVSPVRLASASSRSGDSPRRAVLAALTRRAYARWITTARIIADRLPVVIFYFLLRMAQRAANDFWDRQPFGLGEPTRDRRRAWARDRHDDGFIVTK